jgi:serine/threonine protein kinase
MNQSIEDCKSSGPTQTDREKCVQRIVKDVIHRRSHGEDVSDPQVIARHPDLQPLLEQRLFALRKIRAAVIAARRAGLSSKVTCPLTDSRLEEPIEIFSNEQFIPLGQWPTIEGYLIKGEIRSGGQATVYKAIHESTGREVAIKVLLGGPFVGSESRERFELESMILAKLDHPNIVKIIDRGRASDGSFFSAMEYIDGCDLDEELLRLKGDLSAILRLFIRIARAIDDAHRSDIVHRDLKPLNILIDRRGEPRILDFGLAFLRDPKVQRNDDRRLTRTGEVFGSLFWTSPEQVSGQTRQIDSRSDIYAIGVMLYHAVSGRFPYPTDGALEDIARHIGQTRPAPLRLAARKSGLRVTSALEETILKALAKSPDQRYASAELLADDLELCLLGRSISARHGSSRKYAATFIAVLALAGGWISLASRKPVPQHPSLRNIVRLPTFINSVGIQFVRIPAGRFVMGSASNEIGRSDDEQAHLVTIPRAFYLSVAVVSQNQYFDVMKENPSDAKFLGPELPVQNVRWNDATAFCKALSIREKQIYRLPIEAEWEYACRAGSTSPLGGYNNLDEAAWYRDNSSLQLHPVALKSPNPWGLYDMIGNVRQWCSDSIPNTFYADGPHGQTTNSVRALRIIKGADYLQPAESCRVAARHFLDSDTRATTLGFRVVCQVPDKSDVLPPQLANGR